MKKVLMLAILFIITNMVAQNYCAAQPNVRVINGTQKKAPNAPSEGSNPIIGNSIKIRDIEIAEYDLPEAMNWDNATAACAKIGNGWRLPSKYELRIIYQNKNLISNLKEDYWSSTLGDFNYYALSFTDGTQDTRMKEKTFSVRPVKSIAMPNDLIIGSTIKINNLEIAQYDFTNKMNWKSANKVCANLGDGWRLPTIEELSVLSKNKDKIAINSQNEGSFGTVLADGDKFGSCYYWSSTEEGTNGALVKDLKNQDKSSNEALAGKDNKNYVRAVKTR